MPLMLHPTGVPGLDTVLAGGLPRGSVLMIAGAPGTGKTVLALQVCFNWAAANSVGGKPGRKALYFSTLSEPHDKLIAHMENFGFFEPAELGLGVEVLSLQAFLESGLEATALALVRQARQSQAGLVVIDGFRALEAQVSSHRELRGFLYRLSAQLSLLGTTTIITVERSADDAESYGEFTTADGVIGLYSTVVGAQQRRRLEVRKLRGVAPLTGLHTYEINGAGIAVYPRLESTISRETNAPGVDLGGPRLPFDLPELDRMIGGGLTPGSATLVVGTVGTGKTLLGLHFLLAGLRRGEPTLFLGFHETREQLLAKGRAFALDLDTHVRSGLLVVHTLAPVELEPDRISNLLCQEVERSGIRRLVLDSVDEIEAPAMREGRASDYAAALYSYLRQHGVSSLFLEEIAQVVAPELEVPGSGLARLAENVLVLRYIAYKAILYRILAVIKMRDSEHERSIREFTIQENTGLIIRESGESASGVLAGITSQLAESDAQAQLHPHRNRRARRADG